MTTKIESLILDHPKVCFVVVFLFALVVVFTTISAIISVISCWIEPVS